MQAPVVEVDYLIMGAGAAGMAFADSLVTESNATMAIVDTQHRPGGHWNRAYPFVRLHQPSAFYGVNSRALGSGAVDVTGLNKGYYELASGAEVTSYFDQVMRRQFLPSGRVHYFPMSKANEDGLVTSLVSGKQHRVKARKIVHASYSNTTVPSMRPPPFPVAPGITCVPVNELPRVAGTGSGYVVIGAGKTGMDACLWLLENGADPDSIRWVMPRDYWWINRATYQPGAEHFERVVESIANGVEALGSAESVDDVFARLEAFGEFRRIDPAVKPTGFHGGFVSDAELALLRGIRNIVRMGRVMRIDSDEIVLERGTIPTGRDILHIDCSAAGIPPKPSRPVFDGDRITPAMGSTGAADVQLVDDRARGGHVRRRGGEEPHLQPDLAAARGEGLDPHDGHRAGQPAGLVEERRYPRVAVQVTARPVHAAHPHDRPGAGRRHGAPAALRQVRGRGRAQGAAAPGRHYLKGYEA